MQYWGLTDLGCVRQQNQDVFLAQELDRGGMLCVVCDGMGGARSGNIASSLAAETFAAVVLEEYKGSMSTEEVDDLLCRAVAQANYTVYDRAKESEEYTGMGTTLVAALMRGRQASIVNIGDSRCYHIDASDIHQVTVDHSIVQLMIERGELLPEEVRDYPGKNLITRAIGTEPMIQGDIFHVELDRQDSLLLCSDGLTNMVDDQEILFEVVHNPDRPGCCQRLLDIAKSRGASDNVTCVLLQL